MFEPTLAVIKTRAKFVDVEVVVGKYQEVKNVEWGDYSCFIVQSPDNKGVLHDFTEKFKEIDNAGKEVFKVVASDLLALTVSKSPGSMGADISFGTSQRFGVPMGYGGNTL